MNLKKLLLMLPAIAGVIQAKADIRLPDIIGSNMVLQQQSRVKLWGWADPYEKITVKGSWDDKVYETTGTRDAKWEIELQTPAAGGPYTISLQGKNTLLLENVLIGEVWLCAGQSNMEMSGSWGLQDIQKELPQAHRQELRFFHIPKTTAAFPQEQVRGQWVVCDSNTLKTFSAVAYFFGKHLRQKLGGPVGLIEAAWGGTAAEVWTPDRIVNSSPVLKKAATLIQPSGMCPFIPGSAYNGMIAPIVSYTIAGVTWYQGENNTDAAATYRPLFTAMIDAWRLAWKQPLPFYYVQVAPFRYKKINAGALLREAQWQCRVIPHTGMVATNDITGNVNDVHPQNKHDVGLRLANWALADHYGRTGIAYKSPEYKSMSVKGAKAFIKISGAEAGLKLKGDTLAEIQIAGADKVFYPAQAVIQGDTIVVWNTKVKKPMAVRYCFTDTAIGNVFSSAGLPLLPFRTDRWAFPGF
ncbi:sialate O-acetylesterase [Niabella beijingensis]|uniref:sialate O-acetylesterase n=1 Tax=Niabella beijingensis TaxID=2872700 RepID=UPI001CBF74B5|nr:sialate O-acetylesterase [Niabella beijingensis]MBZ4187472.1 sialate O-acetylesterase [Niabella beijingensis]